MKIEYEGEYRHGDWVTTSLVAIDKNCQEIRITLDTDGTYVIESKLLGDNDFMVGYCKSIEQAWEAIGDMFGVI